jgi:magnesium transporter
MGLRKPDARDHTRPERETRLHDGIGRAIRWWVFETSSLLELQRQGIITRQLAAWAAILGVPAAIAGIYGTTAPHVPELRGLVGYAIVIGTMLAICLGLFIRFKKLRWL